MAVTECKISMDSIRLTDTSQSNGMGSTVTATYRLTSSTQMMAAEIRDSAYATNAGPHPLPRRYDEYSIVENGTEIDSEKGVYCRTLAFRPTGETGRFQWDCDVTWGPLDAGQSPTSAIENPLLRPVEYWIEQQTETVVVEKAHLISPNTLVDANGADVYFSKSHAQDSGKIPIVNAALRQFDDVITRDVTYPVYVAKRNIPDPWLPLLVTQEYENTTNSDELPQFGNVAVGTLRFLNSRCGEVQTEGRHRFHVQITRVAYKAGGWDNEIANVGKAFYFEPSSDPDLAGWPGAAAVISDDEALRKYRETIKNKKPLTPVDPIPLTVDGKRLSGSSQGNYITYRDLEQVSYASL